MFSYSLISIGFILREALGAERFGKCSEGTATKNTSLEALDSWEQSVD